MGTKNIENKLECIINISRYHGSVYVLPLRSSGRLLLWWNVDVQMSVLESCRWFTDMDHEPVLLLKPKLRD